VAIVDPLHDMMLGHNVGTLGHIADFAFRLAGFATLKSLQMRPATLVLSLVIKWRSTVDEDGRYCFAVAL
jgi:hypothetical protein